MESRGRTQLLSLSGPTAELLHPKCHLCLMCAPWPREGHVRVTLDSCLRRRGLTPGQTVGVDQSLFKTLFVCLSLLWGERAHVSMVP